jgi:hypothetical protein
MAREKSIPPPAAVTRVAPDLALYSCCTVTPKTAPRAIARTVRLLAIAALLVAVADRSQRVSAQVYEWVDEAGDRHFDTSLDEVPEALRDQARVVVREEPPAPADEAPPEDASPPAQPNEENPLDQSFDAGWDAGFGAGWEAGYRAAADEAPECAAEPQVVALESRPPVVISVPVPFYDPSGAYYRSPYNGLLTVPFDDGASRGLTGRSQIMQQRALERGW